jgi:hypothetical protein
MAQKPVYVKLDDYKTILTLVDTVKQQVHAAQQTLDEIKKLKQEEDVELEIWQTVVTEIENRIAYIDNTITEPEM